MPMIKSYGITVTKKTPTLAKCIDWITANTVADKYVSNVQSNNVCFTDHNLIFFKYKKHCKTKVHATKRLRFKYETSSVNNFVCKLSELQQHNIFNLTSLIKQVQLIHNLSFKKLNKLILGLPDT